MIDYGSVAMMLAAPKLLGLQGPARTLSYAFAGSYLLLSALTDDPLGLKKMVPFPTHGKVELASAPALVGLPWMMGAMRDPKARMYFLGLLGTVAAVYSLTDWQGNTEA